MNATPTTEAPSAWVQAHAHLEKGVAEASQADAIMRAAARRKLKVEVQGVEMEIAYPGEAMRRRCREVMARTFALAQDPPTDDDEAERAAWKLKEDMADLALALAEGAGFTRETFLYTDHGNEVAAEIVGAAFQHIKNALQVMRSFRKVAPGQGAG